MELDDVVVKINLDYLLKKKKNYHNNILNNIIV
jgi:hypothetical protein